MENTFHEWRRYNIFISSTFRDMDFERNAIKFRVIPELNKRFRDRRIEFRAIDLRMGINTAEMSEDESERKVLTTCASSIDSARPFFIGLVGARYGWIPPRQRWEEFYAMLSPVEKQALADTEDCSVTEIEFVYGALSEQSLKESHTLFFFRDDASYETLPEALRNDFIDTDSLAREKMELLKQRIIGTMAGKGGSGDKCLDYHISYNPETGCFESESFVEMLVGQLCRQIELECPADGSGKSWWQKEADDCRAEMLRCCRDAVDGSVDGADITDRYDACIITAEAGGGKSTLMAQAYRGSLACKGRINLCAIIGYGPSGNSMRTILERWIHELDDLTGTASDAAQTSDPAYPDIKVFDRFMSLVSEQAAKGREVWAFVDNLDALSILNPRDLNLTWINRDLHIVLAAEPELCGRITAIHDWLTVLPATDVRPSIESIAGLFQRQYYLELPSEADFSRIASPLQLRSIFNLLQCAAQQDLENIRRSGNDAMAAINSFILKHWNSMPEDAGSIRTYLSNALIPAMGLSDRWKEIPELIDASVTGLRESDIEALIGKDWNALDFHRFISFLGDFYKEDSTQHLWRANYRSTSDIKQTAKQAEYRAELAEYCAKLPEGDFLREKAGIYYAITAGRADLAGRYLIPDVNHFSLMQPRMYLCHSLLNAQGFIRNGALAKFSKSLDNDKSIQLAFHLFNAGYCNSDDTQANLPAYIEICGDGTLPDVCADSRLMYALILQKSDLGLHRSAAIAALKSCIAEKGPDWNDVRMHLLNLDPDADAPDDVAQTSHETDDDPAKGLSPEEALKFYAAKMQTMSNAEEMLALSDKLLESQPDDRMRSICVNLAQNAADLQSRQRCWKDALRACDKSLYAWGDRLEAASDNEIGLQMLFRTYISIDKCCKNLCRGSLFHRVPRELAAHGKEMQNLLDEIIPWIITRICRINPQSQMVRIFRSYVDDRLLKVMQNGEDGSNPVVENIEAIHSLADQIGSY